MTTPDPTPVNETPASAAYEDGTGNFLGHAQRECGEHRTVGEHRAWCHDCSEWCYPSVPCRGCELPHLRADVSGLRAERRALWELLKDSAWARIELRGEYDKAVSAWEKLADALQVIDVAMGNEVPPFSHWSVIADRIRAMRADLAKWMDQNTRLDNERDQARRELEEARAESYRLREHGLKLIRERDQAQRERAGLREDRNKALNALREEYKRQRAQAWTGETTDAIETWCDRADDVLSRTNIVWDADMDDYVRPHAGEVSRALDALALAGLAPAPGTGDTAQPGDDVIEHAARVLYAGEASLRHTSNGLEPEPWHLLPLKGQEYYLEKAGALAAAGLLAARPDTEAKGQDTKDGR